MINLWHLLDTFCQMYICVFHVLKELFEEFYAKTVWSTPGTYDSCLMLILSIIHHIFMLPRIWFTFFGVTGQKCITFMLSALSLVLLPALVPIPDPTLRPAPRPAQKWWEIWWLWYWHPVVGESRTWVLFVLAPSSYWTPDKLVLVVK